MAVYAKEMRENLDEYVANIQKMALSATEEEINQGLIWYQRARDTAERLAEIYNVSLEKVAGIIAALSPRVRWELNLLDAATLLLEEEEAKVNTFNRNKDKALDILWGTEEPLAALTRVKNCGMKTAAFFKNIMHPYHSPPAKLSPKEIRERINRGENLDDLQRTPQPVTIDAHASRAAINWQMNDEEHIVYCNTPRKYEILEEAYRRAAEKIGIYPQQLQAITWLAYKRQYGRNGTLRNYEIPV